VATAWRHLGAHGRGAGHVAARMARPVSTSQWPGGDPAVERRGVSWLSRRRSRHWRISPPTGRPRPASCLPSAREPSPPCRGVYNVCPVRDITSRSSDTGEKGRKSAYSDPSEEQESADGGTRKRNPDAATLNWTSSRASCPADPGHRSRSPLSRWIPFAIGRAPPRQFTLLKRPLAESASPRYSRAPPNSLLVWKRGK